MTLLFAAMLSLFCLIALGQLLWSSQRPTPTLTSSTDLNLRAWYQSASQELNQQLTRAEISQVLYDQNYLALQREYLITQTQASTPAFATHAHLTIRLLLSVTLIAASSGFYWQQGSAPALVDFYHAQKTSRQAEAVLNTLGGSHKVITLLQAQLKKHPSDSRAWYLLGRLYFTDNQYSLAIDAFSHANILLPNQRDVQLSLAESCYLSGRHAAKAAYYLHQVLNLDPNNPGALNLTALIAYQDKHYQHAIDLWQQLLRQVPENSDTAKALLSAIDKARHAQA